MNTFVATGLLACICASALSAADYDDVSSRTVRIGFSLNYTSTEMDKLNNEIGNGTAATPLRSGIAGMFDADFALAPFLMAGIRTGYLNCMPAEARYNYVVYNRKSTYSTSLVPLEGGVNIRFVLPSTPISILTGIYAGYGFAFATVKNDVDALGQAESYTQTFYNGGFMGELIASVNYRLASVFSFNVNGGYRLANIPRMMLTKDVSYNPLPGVTVTTASKGDVLKDSGNNDLAFDFSGFVLGIGFSLDY